MASIEGELNRRLVVLAVLYIQRRTNPYTPEVSRLEVERRLGFPRDDLELTARHLRNRGHITRADNSDFTWTADGLDLVESQRVNIPRLNRLLTSGSAGRNAERATAAKGLIPQTPIIVPNPHEPIIVPASSGGSNGNGPHEDVPV